MALDPYSLQVPDVRCERRTLGWPHVRDVSERRCAIALAKDGKGRWLKTCKEYFAQDGIWWLVLLM